MSTTERTNPVHDAAMALTSPLLERRSGAERVGLAGLHDRRQYTATFDGLSDGEQAYLLCLYWLGEIAKNRGAFDESLQTRLDEAWVAVMQP